MGVRTHDREDLDETITEIRKVCPGAVAAIFSTTDQDRCGFLLTDVELPGGRRLDVTDPAALERLQNEVWHLTSSLGWNGLLGEDRYGHARLAL